MTPADPDPMPLDALERIDRACVRFELLWRGGRRPDLRDHLTGAGAERRALFRELLKLELEYRLQADEQPSAGEYARRFPDEGGADAFAAAAREQVLDGAPDPGPLARYRIERVLGRGAYGVVYQAEDTELHRAVALKVAQHPRRSTGADAFLEEARVLASLDHPAVVPVYDAGRAGGRSYIVTKLIDGSSLSARLRRGLPPHRQAAGWALAVARGLQAAHEKGLVHRDVKPSNILLDRAGAAYIGDFGLALRGTPEADAPRVLGTPAYMSPEQARGDGDRADARSDVFGLGAVLYELLTGRAPFRAETISRTLEQVLHADPVAPTLLNPSVGRDLETVCLKCLAKRPERRYPTAAALADDLQRFLDGRAVRARPVGPAERLLKWARRNPALAAALAAAATSAAVALVLVSWSYVRAEAARADEFGQRQKAEQRERAERWERYRSNLVAASSALEVHNAEAAADALAAAPPEHRNWEWRHLHSRLDTAEHVLRVPPVKRAARAADGSALLLCPGAVPHRIGAGERTAAALDLDFPTASAVLAPDGRGFAAQHPDGRLVFRAGPGARPVTTAPGGPVGSLCFNPDGTRAAAAVGTAVRVWDARTGAELFALEGHTNEPGIAFSRDGRLLATSGRAARAVHLWDARDGRALGALDGHAAPVSLVAFDPAGRLLTCELYPGNAVRVWDAATRAQTAVLRGHTNEALAVAFTADGARGATASYDQTVRLWELGSGRALGVLAGHKGWVNGVAFSPDGARVATTSQDRTVRLWDAATGDPRAVLHLDSTPLELWYTPDGETLAAVSEDGRVRFWGARRAEYGVLRGHTDFVYGVAFSPDGGRVASAAWDGSVRLWDAATGRERAVLRPETKAVVYGVAFHPGGRWLASVGREECVRLWDADTGTALGRLPTPHAGHESRPAFSPAGDRLAAGCSDGTVRVWAVGPQPPADAPEPAVLRGHTGPVEVVAFGPQGRWLASAGHRDDPTVRIWDVDRGTQTRALSGHTNAIVALTVSPDGAWLASGSYDGTVRLWDTATWEPVVLTQGSPVYGLSFTPDGTRLACGCANNTLRLWDTATRQPVCDLTGHTGYVHDIAFSPDGTRLVSGSGDFTVRIWDTVSSADRAAARK